MHFVQQDPAITTMAISAMSARTRQVPTDSSPRRSKFSRALPPAAPD
jgi:hypothetical protein